VAPGKGGEIQLTDGIAALMKQERVLAYRFDGKRFDCGSKLGYMKANVEFALRHPEISAEFTDYLRKLKF
jgi:UTP--glucose-1-phosphate uridylyltransferase